jgi:DNA polymerase-3 subunit delta
MRLRPEQLDAHLRQPLLPIYVLSGDEPLQIQEASDTIRAAARRGGYDNRELFVAESGFDWNALRLALESSSLFGERKIIDLRLPGGAPAKEGAKIIEQFAGRPADDTLLLLSQPRLSSSDQKAGWLQAVERIGALLQVWPLEGIQLLDWLERRLKRHGMTADRAVAQFLAGRVEGNLLAAVQEIDKLYALHGPGHLSLAAVEDAVADNSRFDVFALSDAALQGQSGRAAHILAVLEAEGTAAPVVLWSLTREIRLLLQLHVRTQAGASLDATVRQMRLPDKRKPALQKALQRNQPPHLHGLLVKSAATDRVIKGMEKGDPWDGLLDVALGLANGQILAVG